MNFTIGEVARAASIGAETIRYYERIGLFQTPKRSVSGYRLYDEQSVRRLRFIKKAQSLGFTLKEIQELLELRHDVSAECQEINQLARAKIAAIEEKIETLQRIKTALLGLAEVCPKDASIKDCPILHALEEDNP